MNKLIFSEGGQPVCLDDLKTLQDMIVETIKPLLLALVKTNVFILDDYDFRNSEIDTERCRRNSSCQQARLLLMVTFSHGQTPLWPLMIGINLYIYVSKQGRGCQNF